MRVMTSHARRGASLVLVAISLVVIMLMAALTIDLGRLLSARAEAQRAADAAALAGASAFITGETGAALQDSAVARAATIAGENEMAAQMIVPGTMQAEGSHSEVFEYVEMLVNDVLDTVPSVTADVYSYSGDEVKVDVIPTLQRVRVTVRRDRVGVWFAKVIGLHSFPIGAQATANAAYAGGTRCVRPIAVTDWWNETTPTEDLPVANHIPDPGETWIFDPAQDPYTPVGTDGSGTGLGSNFRKDGLTRDRGRKLVLRDQQQVNQGPGSACVNSIHCLGPGWWGLWDPKAENGVAKGLTGIKEALSPELTEANCPVVEIGNHYGYQPGAISSIKAQFDEILAGAGGDPGARWDPNADDPTSALRGSVVGCKTCPADWRSSPRVWVMGIMSPYEAELISRPGGDKLVHFNNFALFFFEGCATPAKGKAAGSDPSLNCKPGDDVVGRFIGIAPGIGPGTSVLTRSLRLVK